MAYSERARPTTRRIRIRRIRVAGLLVVIAAIAAALGYQLLASASSTAASPIDVLRSEHRDAPGEADGAVPDGTTVFDDEIPGVANLDSDLLGADDFRNRTGFTYTVLEPASRDVIGCVYVYPLPDSDYDAPALSWVRASHAQLDTPLWRVVSEWLASDWPFGSVEYAPRT